MTVAFTGHRPDKLGGYLVPNKIYNFVCSRIKETLIELRPSKIITGMALGVDQWAANIAIELSIPFIAAVPFDGQERAWPDHSQEFYHSLLKNAEEKIVISKGSYAAYKMQVRNKWMVDHCDILVAVWDGSNGGTKNCVNYAESIGKKIVFINPKI